MKDNILCNIDHFPLLITKIFHYSLKRPFILYQMLHKSEYLKDKLNNLKIDKFNGLSKETNKLFYFLDEIINFEKQYQNIMTKEIKIEEEENNFFTTKPYINSLFEISDKLFSTYKSFFPYDKDKNLFAKSLFEFCLNQPYIKLSINLFTKDNDINRINMELTESDLDFNYIKLLNQSKYFELIKIQKMKLCINIYNKYTKLKRNNFSQIVYFNNINLLKNLNIEEINFIRPNIKEKEIIENILYKNEIIDEINTMFLLIQELKYKNKIIQINFSDSIIKNISLFYNEKILIKSFNNNNEFVNLKKIGINSNLVNKNIKNILLNLFNYNLPFIYYQDITNSINNKNFFNNLDNDTFYINLENNIIYDINLFKYLSDIFNAKNVDITKKINIIEIIYNCEDIYKYINNSLQIEKFFLKEKINNCYLPNLKEIRIKNNTNKVYKKIIPNKNKIFNFLSFIGSFSQSLSTIIIKDSYIPFNILDFENINLNNIIKLSLKSPSLNNYTYREIIEKINKFKNLEFIYIDTLSSNFNDSFDDITISKDLIDIKEFYFNDFFIYENIEKKKIIYKQNNNINKDLFFIFSEIIENEKNLEKMELNGFLYNFDKIRNQNLKNIEINLEEDDKDYIINKIKFQKINLKLQNFPNLNSLYIYVDILQTVENFIQLPINLNLKRMFLFSSYINCDINALDDLLKKNGVELIVRTIGSYNKGMIMAYIASFPHIQDQM